jgi:TPR repeat protein
LTITSSLRRYVVTSIVGGPIDDAGTTMPAVSTKLCLTALAGFLLSSCGVDRAALDKACEENDAKACHELGTSRIHGLDGKKDRKQGRLDLERACELGHLESCHVAGGLSYARRDRRARRYFQLGCDKGDLPSCVDLGWMKDHGEGGDTDRAAAEKHYKKACDGGDADGCVLLGLTWRPAPGGRGDPARMRSYYDRACELGYAPACQAGDR